jgi:uncharacterized glyoxalase superfamily protein PhnB
VEDGGAQLTSVAPVLLVRDVRAAADHYRDVLGFAFDRIWGDPPSFVMLARDGLHLMLKQADDPRHVVPHWTVSNKLCAVYFWVSNADALHAELTGRGAKIDYGLCNQPHGCREFGVQDIDGHDIAFGEILK